MANHKRRLGARWGLGFALLAAAACGDIEPGDVATSGAVTGGGLKSRSNSLVRLPFNSYFADIDGDGIAEMVTALSNQLYITRNDFASNGVAHHYFDQPIRELAVGRFSGTSNKQELCAYLENDWFECIRWVSADLGFETWLSTGGSHPTSPSIVQPARSERMIVGNFNGDSKDDIMTHDPANGSVRFMSVRTDLGCDPTLGCGPVFALVDVRPGDLLTAKETGFNLGNKEIYAGQFAGSTDRDDLLVVNRSSGKVYRFDAVAKVSGTTSFTTFQIGTKTCTGVVGAGDALAIGNVDGSTADAIVAYNPVTGETRFQRAVSGCTLATVPMQPSQLAGAAAAGSRPFLGKMSKWPGEPGTEVREDILFYSAGPQQYVRADARYFNGNTYWWAYTQNNRRFDTQMPAMGPPRKWLILMCSDSDVPPQPWFNTTRYTWLYGKTGRNTPNMYNFFKDMSYGSDNYTPVVKGVFPLTTPQSTRYRDQSFNECVAASHIDISQYFRTTVITNGEDDFGAFGGIYSTLASWQSSWIGGPGHEMGHALGLPHDYLDHFTGGCGGEVDGQYCDASDIMGMPYGYVWGTDFKLGGEGFSVTTGFASVSKLLLGYIPTARQVKVVSGAARQTQRFELAGLDRPESVGALVVSIQPGSDPSDTWAIDFRSKRGRWDVALPKDGVMVRHSKFVPQWGTVAGFLEWQPDPFLQPGQSFTEGNFTLSVVSIDSANGRAVVDVTY